MDEVVDKLKSITDRLLKIVEAILGVECISEDKYREVQKALEEVAKNLEDAASKLEDWYRRVAGGGTNVARR